MSLAVAKKGFGPLILDKSQIDEIYGAFDEEDRVQLQYILDFLTKEMAYSPPAAKHIIAKYLESYAHPDSVGGMSLAEMISKAHNLYQRTKQPLSDTVAHTRMLVPAVRRAITEVKPHLVNVKDSLVRLYKAAMDSPAPSSDEFVEVKAEGKKRTKAAPKAGSQLFG